MNDFDTYLGHLGDAAQKRLPMTSHEWKALICGLGIPLVFLILLVAFIPR